MPKQSMAWPVPFDFQDPDSSAQISRDLMSARFALLPKSRIRGKTSLIRHAVDSNVQSSSASVEADAAAEAALAQAAEEAAAAPDDGGDDPFGYLGLPM